MLWLLTFNLCYLVLAEVAIWPEPVSISKGQTVAWVSEQLQAEFHCPKGASPSQLYLAKASKNVKQKRQQFSMGFEDGKPYLSSTVGSNQTSPLNEAAIVRDAVDAALESIVHTSFVPWKFHKMNFKFDSIEGEHSGRLERIVIIQHKCPAETALDPRDYFAGDESYTLTTDDDTMIIKANSTLGTLRALETMKQLFYRTPSGRLYVDGLPLEISDYPRFRYRGLSIDIARNPIAPEDILRNIEAMATVKLNRLHIHATDSQSWPLEIPALPKLAEKGSYQASLIWTASALKQVQEYGVMKGISVFVEIDAPGHTASIAHAYPDLITAFNMSDWSTFALEPLSGQLKLKSPEVKAFMHTLLEDLLPRVSSYTTLFHMGGDEVNENAYLLDETVQSNDPKILQPLFQKFMSSVVNQALLNGLQPIVWEEMVLDWNLTLPKAKPGSKSPATLVQVWRNSERINEVLHKGHRVIFGDYRHWYLDCGFGMGFLDPYPSGESPAGVPYNTSGGFPSKLQRPYLDYCNPYHNWREMLMYDPLAGVDEALYELVEGGEALMWSETTDGVDLDFKLWPRAGAAAEVLWSRPRKDTMLENASRRLAHWRERAVSDLHIRSSPVHMTWCLMEGGCNL